MSLLGLWTKLQAKKEIRYHKRALNRMQRNQVKGRKVQEKQLKALTNEKQYRENALNAQKNWVTQDIFGRAASLAGLTAEEQSLLTQTTGTLSTDNAFFKSQKYTDFISKKNDMSVATENQFASLKSQLDEYYTQKTEAITEGWAQIDEQYEQEKQYHEDMISLYEDLAKSGEELSKSNK